MGNRRSFRSPTEDDVHAVSSVTGPSSFLGALRRADLEVVLERCRTIDAGRGEVLLRSEDDVALFLLRGAALVRTTTANGNTAVLAFLDPGSSWGLEAALGQPPSDLVVAGLTATTGLVIGGRDLRTIISRNPSVAVVALRTVSRMLVSAREESVLFTSGTATERVVHRLLELSARWGRMEHGRVSISLPLTQDQLASWARTSRESTAKALHDLRRSGIVQTGRRELVILDPDGLAARLEHGNREATLRDLLTLTS